MKQRGYALVIVACLVLQLHQAERHLLAHILRYILLHQHSSKRLHQQPQDAIEQNGNILSRVARFWSAENPDKLNTDLITLRHMKASNYMIYAIMPYL